MLRSIRVAFVAVLTMAAPSPTPAQVSVSFVPNGGTFTNPSVGVTVKWCSNTTTLNASSRVIKLNGQTITSQFSYVNDVDACTHNKRSGGTIQLQLGANTLFASIQNSSGQSASYSTTFTLSDKWPATVAVAYADKFRDVGRCVADCFAAVAQYSTPSYTSLDVARGVTLLYRSDRARPQGFVQIEATDNSPTPVEAYSLLLRKPDLSFVTFVNGSQELYFTGGAGVTTLAAQFDASGIATEALNYTAVVRSRWSDGTVRETTTPARVMIVNGAGSVFGAGWDVAANQTAYPQSGGGVMVASGDGSMSFFTGCVGGPCQFTSPPGDFSVLTIQSDQTFVRRYSDGTEFRFNAAGLLTSIADRLGITTTIWRDLSGRITSITDPLGYGILFGYSGIGGTFSSITIPGAGGASKTSAFTIIGGTLEQAFDPDGIKNFQASYSSYLLTNITDRRGGQWSYSYDDDGLLEHADAPTINVSGVGSTRPRVTVSAPSRVMVGRIWSGYGSSASPIPRTDDLRAWVRNARNYTTYFTTNRWGSPRVILFANGDSTRATYDATTGQITQSVSETGHHVQFMWNGVQLTQMVDATIGQTVNATYESTYNRLLTISGNTVSRTFTYPDARTITMQAGSHPPDTLRLDYFGRDSSFRDGGGHQTKSYFSTSGLRNTDSTESPGARRVRFRYDNFGRVVARLDPIGDRDSATYDLIDRQLTAVDANNRTTTFNYDSLFLRKVTDARNLDYVFVRNALGWVEQETRPGSTALVNAYDANGNVASHTNRRGQTTSFVYDALDRIASRTADGQTTTWAYQTPTASVDGYVAVTNSESSDTVVMNVAERLVRQSTARGGNWYGIAYSYNTDGTLASTNATSNTWSGAKTQSFGYNATNATQSFTTWAGTTTLNPGISNEDLASSITYPSGLVASRTFGSLHTNFNLGFNVTDVNNRLGAQLILDANGRIIERAKPANDSARSYMYAYGRIWQQNRYSVNSRTGCTQNPDYGYQCTNDYAFIGADQLTYDDVGNLLNGSAQVASNSNRLLSAHGYTFDYDADGNLTGKQTSGLTQRFGWNALGLLVADTTNGIVSTYGYDGSGRRVRRTVNGVTKRYLHDGDNLFMELDSGGSPVVEYAYWGLDNPHSMLKGGQTYYFVQDPVGGSVKGLVRHSDHTVQAQYGYKIFGLGDGGSDAVGNALQFAGRELDNETGLYFNRARYFDPLVGRFISEDPIGLDGGINPYAYAGNDPVDARDPTGLQCREIKVSEGIVTSWGEMVGYEPPTVRWVCPQDQKPWDHPRTGSRGGSGRRLNLGPCVKASVWFSFFFTLDVATAGAGAAVARAGYRFSGATVAHFTTMVLHSNWRAAAVRSAGAAANEAASNLVRVSGSAISSTAKGLPLNAAVGVVETGGWSWSAFVPFDGTMDRVDQVANECSEVSGRLIGY